MIAAIKAASHTDILECKSVNIGEERDILECKSVNIDALALETFSSERACRTPESDCSWLEIVVLRVEIVQCR